MLGGGGGGHAGRAGRRDTLTVTAPLNDEDGSESDAGGRHGRVRVPSGPAAGPTPRPACRGRWRRLSARGSATRSRFRRAPASRSRSPPPRPQGISDRCQRKARTALGRLLGPHPIGPRHRGTPHRPARHGPRRAGLGPCRASRRRAPGGGVQVMAAGGCLRGGRASCWAGVAKGMRVSARSAERRSRRAQPTHWYTTCRRRIRVAGCLSLQAVGGPSPPTGTPPARGNVRAHTHTRARARTHTHTHTHTHTRG